MQKKQAKLDTLRHSTAHLMAAAVKDLWPDTKLGIGPVIEDGFYYDFARPKQGPFRDEELPRIEEKMRELIAKKIPYKKVWFTIKVAERFFKNRKEQFKVELIRELSRKKTKKVSAYWTGDAFVDLCTGPHVKNSSEIPASAFKLLRTASAYWHGDEKNPQLSRIYGTVFSQEEELEKYLALQKEIARRDHRKIGQELDLFSFHDIAPGAAFWHPKGMIIVKELEKYWRRVHEQAGYSEIATPILVKKELFEKSGHWQYYRENIFHFMLGNEEYALKPMNCPESTYVYNTRVRSFRDLPLRLSEIGRLHRNERSGTLSGLFRVKQITMDDAHIYCALSSVEEEISNVLKLVKEFYTLFDFTPQFFLATKPDKAMGSAKDWQEAQKALKGALTKNGFAFTLKPKDGAFYGPKIDIHINDALGRDWQLATIQLDLVMLPERFDLLYTDKDGTKKRPVVIHRAIFGSFERFLGMLIEHTAGNLPLWLAPIQLAILPIAERHLAYARECEEKLTAEGFRVVLSNPDETLSKRIREVELQKIPYLAVAGDREVEAHTMSIREHTKGNLGAFSLTEVIAFLKTKLVPDAR